MKKFLLGFSLFAGFLIIILLLDFLFLKWFIFIEPQREDTKREVFLNTRSYIEGKTQDLVKYMYEYKKATKEEKQIIASIIRHSFAEFDESKLKSEKLRSFLKKIKYGD